MCLCVCSNLDIINVNLFARQSCHGEEEEEEEGEEGEGGPSPGVSLLTCLPLFPVLIRCRN